jgi:hypothetical protein
MIKIVFTALILHSKATFSQQTLILSTIIKSQQNLRSNKKINKE